VSTLDDAESKSQSTTGTINLTSPISSFSVSNPSGQNVEVSFDSDINIANIEVSISGAESATLTEADFSESGGTYSATYDGSSDGDYTATLTTADDDDGNDVLRNERSDTVSVSTGGGGGGGDTDTTAPTISSFSVSNPSGQDVEVSFDSSETLSSISVSITGAETATLTASDFTESGGTYTATYQASTDGDYTATLDTAEDSAGNDGASSQSGTVTVDTPPSISSFSVANPSGQNVEVSFDSDENLANIQVAISGAETATLTESDFSGSGSGTYTATYNGNSDGDYTATLDIAEVCVGNNGASEHSDTVSVDTSKSSL